MDGRWLAERINTEAIQADCLIELGAAHYEKADLATAKGYAGRALALTVRLSALARAGQASTILAAVQRDEKDLAGAEQQARLSISFCRQGHDPMGEAVALNLLGELCHKRARLDEAAEAWSMALAIFEDIGDPRADPIRTMLQELSNAPVATPAQTRRLYDMPPDRVETPR
jgi:tetratricopeptide (TPR) repeat protein